MSEHSKSNVGTFVSEGFTDPKKLKTKEPFKSLFPRPAEVFDEIVESMESGGFKRSFPIIVWSGKGVVIDGHTRKDAAIKAGIEEVKVEYWSYHGTEEAVVDAFRRQSERRQATPRDFAAAYEQVRDLVYTYMRTWRNQGRPRKEAKKDDSQESSFSEGAPGRKAIAKELGMSEMAIERIEAVRNSEYPDIWQSFLNGTRELKPAYEELRRRRRVDKEQQKQKEREEQKSEEPSEDLPLDEGDDSEDPLDIPLDDPPDSEATEAPKKKHTESSPKPKKTPPKSLDDPPKPEKWFLPGDKNLSSEDIGFRIAEHLLSKRIIGSLAYTIYTLLRMGGGMTLKRLAHKTTNKSESCQNNISALEVLGLVESTENGFKALEGSEELLEELTDTKDYIPSRFYTARTFLDFSTRSSSPSSSSSKKGTGLSLEEIEEEEEFGKIKEALFTHFPKKEVDLHALLGKVKKGSKRTWYEKLCLQMETLENNRYSIDTYFRWYRSEKYDQKGLALPLLSYDGMVQEFLKHADHFIVQSKPHDKVRGKHEQEREERYKDIQKEIEKRYEKEAE